MAIVVFWAALAAYLAGLSEVAAFAPAPAGFWWLNSFLDNQTIGRYETFDGFSPQMGPCPNQANKCQINLATLPTSVKNIGVTLPAPFGNNITLGQALPSGFIQFWYTEVNDVQLGQVSVVGGAESATRQRINVTIRGFKANVGLMLAIRQVPIPIPGNLDVLFAGTTANKSLQGNGTDINFVLYVDVPPGKTFANSFPSNITMGNCSIKLSLALNVNPARFSATTPFNDAVNGVTNLLLGIAEPILGNAVCGIIRQLFYTFDGQKGLISTFVTDAYNAVGNLSSNVPPTLPAQDLNFSQGLTATQRNKAFNFGTSNVVRGASVVANNWLGQPSASNPTVNEVVNLLTSPTNGSATYTDLASLGFSIPISTPVANITVDVDSLRISGMNSFGLPYGFQLIKNNYDNASPRLNWTLDNKFSLDNLGINFLANITLVTNRNPPSSNGWVYVRNAARVVNTTKFTLNYTLSLVDLDVALALSLALNTAEVQNLKIGQLLGKQSASATAISQAIQGGKCAAPSVYGAAIPFLQLNLGDIVTPVFSMTPQDAGITQLVNDATSVGLTILKSATTTNLPDVSQYWVRPLANRLFKNFFTADGIETDCPDYVSQGKTQLNLRDSIIFRIAKNTIANAVGGDPVRISRASINELVAQLVTFACEAFASPATCQNPAPGVWQFLPSLSVFPGKSFPAPSSFPTSIAVTGVNLNGVNSVYKLLLNNVVPTQQGFNLLLELGQVSNPLVIVLRNRWRVDYPTVGALAKPDVDEIFNLTISLQGFRLNLTVLPDFDLDQLYQLKLSDVTKSACVLAPFAANILDLKLSTTSFNVLVSRQSIIANGNPLLAAFNQVIIDQGAGYPNINSMFNVVLQSVGKFVSNSLSGLNNTVINATNCATQNNAFDTFFLRVGLAALSANLTDVLSKATGPQPAVPAPRLLDATVFQPFGSSPYNLNESAIPALINNGLKGITQANFKTLMQNLGNNSGDVLSDIFITEPDSSVSLDVNFTQFDYFKDGFDLSFLIENATLFLNRLRLTNITALDMASLDVIKPVSKFVLDTNITFKGRQDFLFSFGLLLPQSLKNATGPRILTNVNITLSLYNLRIALQTLTALDAKRVNGLAVGNFLTVDSEQTFGLNPNAITCLLRLFFPGGLSIPKLLIGLDSLGTPLISASNYQFISQGTVMTLNAMLGILADFFIPDLADLTQGGLRVLINEYLLKPNLERPGVCLNPTPPPLTGNSRILNFKRSSTVGRINNLTKNILAGDNGRYTLMNTIISAAVDNKVFLDQTLNRQLGFNSLEIVYKKVVFGTIGGAARDVIMNNVGTFTGLNLLNAKTNTSIANNISIAGPLDFGVGITWFAKDVWTTDFGFDGQKDEIRLDLKFTNITIGFNLDIALDIPEFLLLQSGSLTNFSQIACVFTAVKNFSISNVLFDVGRIRATITCDGVCESPLLKGIANGIPLTSGDNNAFLNGLPTLLIIGANFIQSSEFGGYINDFIDSAGRSCNKALDLSTVYSILNPTPVEGLKVATIFALALLGIGCALFLLAPLAIPRHYQLKDKMLAENLLFANSQPGANAQSVARFMAKMERDQIALAWHPAVNSCCKCFVPVMALVNVVLLGLSFVGFLAFSLQGRLFILGGETRPLTLVPWSVSSTINDMWNSGAWPLSILIVFASCAWPVAKNIALFGIWFAPKTFLTHEKREWYLVQLDVLGKWSFLDVYIINILVGGLKMTLSLGEAAALQILPIPSQFFVIDTVLTPETGIILLATAAYMSLVVNHVIMWEMYKAEWADRRLFKQIDGENDDMLTPKAGIRLAISEYVFSTTTPTGQRDRYGPKAKNTVILLLGVAMVWLIVGYAVPYMAFNYDGLIGYTIGFFVSGGRKRPFSLFQFGLALPAASTGTPIQNATFAYFAGLYFITVIIAPMLQMILHLFLWLKPLSLKDAHTVLFFSKVAAYWASLEVFCLGIVATTIEIKPVTTFLLDFITGGSCAALKAPLSGALGEQNGACLNPSANLEWGFAIAFTANLFQIFCGAVMIRASGVAIRDREDVLERRPHPQWSYLEYLVLDKLLVHGAAHHKPPADPNRKKSLFERITVDCVKNPTATCSSCLSATASKVNCCSGCFTGVDDVALTTPVGKTGGKVANSKWNVPSTMQSSNKWNTSYGAPPSANPSWNMSQAGGAPRSSAMVANNSMTMDSPNPVFARETQKRYSIDV